MSDLLHRLKNIVIQHRVVAKKCIDCGAQNTHAGYCKNKVCGAIETPITVSGQELQEAKIQFREGK